MRRHGRPLPYSTPSRREYGETTTVRAESRYGRPCAPARCRGATPGRAGGCRAASGRCGCRRSPRARRSRPGRAGISHGADAERVGHLQKLVSSSATAGSGWRSPMGRSCAACLAMPKAWSLVPPRPTPMITGGQVRPGARTRQSRRAPPCESRAVRPRPPASGNRCRTRRLVDRAELDPVRVGLDPVLDVRRKHPDIVPGIASRDRMAAIGAQRQVTRDPLRRTAYGTLQGDEPAAQHRLVADHGIDARTPTSAHTGR